MMLPPPDDDVRLGRRIQRDVAHRGRDVASVIEQYTRFVKPAFDTYVGPSRRCILQDLGLRLATGRTLICRA
jgi:uridine kinase